MPKDTVVLDTLTIVPGSFTYKTYPPGISGEFDPVQRTLVFGKERPDSLTVSYRRFPVDFGRRYFHKDARDLYTDRSRPFNPFAFKFDNAGREKLFVNDGLIKNGNISRGISFGNNQDVVVNSNLNLQASGKLTPEIDMVLAATDNNIPFQPDGTTAQLQEFDKVYIQLSNPTSKMIVGDYQLSRPQNSYFMNFYKRSQGLFLDNAYTDSSFKKPVIFRTQVSGAVSKGKFARQVFFGVESNQGPYRLRGANGEPFIIVLSGTEKIYIDGRLMQRGQENDYIIDYNTGEITFTARQLITKDKRIVAEFQYAERNYSRSLFFAGEEISTRRSKAYVNFFSEQDNKDRPLQQELTQPQKDVMIRIGDTLSKAFADGSERVEFTSSEVLYRRADTVVNDIRYTGIFIYSTDPDTARYRLKFSNVGQGNGNYRQLASAANGKVYEWVPPLNGVPQGMFEPVIPLVTPKLHQMVVGGFTHSLTAQNSFTVEGVYTRNDVNRFSGRDKRNDEGSGVRLNFVNSETLAVDSLKRETRLIYNGSYEFVQQRFTQVERFRSIEFERDWNRPLNGGIRNDQHLANAEAGFQKAGVGELVFGYASFSEAGSFEGQRQQVRGSLKNRNSSVSYAGSYLNAMDALLRQRSSFYRHKASASQRIGKLKVGYADEFENNRFRGLNTDSLHARAYQFWEWEASIATADSGKTNIRVFYRERNDKLAHYDHLRDSTRAENIGLQAGIYAIKNNPITLFITYRKLELKKITGNSLRPDNTMLNRVEYSPKYFNGFITANLFYETGFGLQNKREFYYLEVAPGQGQFTWNDYNNNQVRELNEFETAQFSDQARYIRIYTPTNEYIKVLQNQLSVSVNLRPSSIIKNMTRKFNDFMSRWLFQSTVRIDNKIGDNGQQSRYNPFAQVADTFLLGSNNNIRQSVFFNQGSAVFGADYTYLDNLGRQLLTNGIEEKSLKSHEIRWRYNFLKAWSVNSSNTYSRKGNSSQFFFTRNYLIESYETEQRLVYQPSTLFRTSVIYRYADRTNTLPEIGQKALIESYGIELKYNQADKGSLTARTDYIRIRYNGEAGSAVGYEILNGLNAGDNFTWELNYQRNLSGNIQLSINYSGRKAAGTGMVHIGGAQVRAFF